MADSIKIHDVATDEDRQFLAEQGVSLDAAQIKALTEFVDDAGGVNEARGAVGIYSAGCLGARDPDLCLELGERSERRDAREPLA